MDVPRTRSVVPVRQVICALTVILLVSVTAALRQWRAAPPSVDLATLHVGTVIRGDLRRSIQGPGILEASDSRWLSATHAGRVEKLLLRPGATVQPNTVIMELSNPEMQLQALEADRQLAMARTEHVRMIRESSTALLQERAALTTLVAEHKEAVRRWEATKGMVEAQSVAALDAQRLEARVSELAERVALTRERLRVLEDQARKEQASHDHQMRTLEQMARFHHNQLNDLMIQAEVGGVLQTQPVEAGQWVVPGTMLGKIARPDSLKAVLRISEVQARDVTVGQKVLVDTRNGVAHGVVSLVAPTAKEGTVTVDVTLPTPLPPGARADARVDGTILVETLVNVLTLPRPAHAQVQARLVLFRIDGDTAARTPVDLGVASATHFEIRGGAHEGDRFILSDMSRWDGMDRLSIH